ncbi:MAG TPA: DUF6377 domain-containing protein [Ohtaekwangia sp.]
MRSLVCIFFLVLGLSAFASDRDSLLLSLNETIANKETFVKAKLERIQKYRRQLTHSDPVKRFELYSKLYEEYKTFIYDSAFIYARKLQAFSYSSGDVSKVNYSKVKLGFILLSAGMFKEALDSLREVDTHTLPDTIKREYYGIMARTYYDLIDFNKDIFYKPLYLRLGNQYIDSAITLCEKGSKQYFTLSGLKNLKLENFDGSIEDFENLIQSFTLSDPEFAVASSTLAYIYLETGNIKKGTDLMIRAAMADIRSATKETLALLNLAELLYKEGNVKDAYFYVKHARDDANFYGSRIRKIQVASIFPVIEGAQLNTVERHRRLLFFYALAVTILSVIIVAFAYIIYRQYQKLKAAEQAIIDANSSLQEINHKLREADKIKDEYIGYYFNINSEYLQKIEAFKKSVDMKLMTKRFEDIRLIVNGINLKKEREELYYSFDKVFLKLFPGFISDFNSLFEEQDRIVIKDDQLLNTELRIFALIRMGINDTEKIAKILDYSVNTIYAYKTRVKSKSIIPNEEFEKRIMEIKAI